MHIAEQTDFTFNGNIDKDEAAITILQTFIFLYACLFPFNKTSRVVTLVVNQFLLLYFLKTTCFNQEFFTSLIFSLIWETEKIPEKAIIFWWMFPKILDIVSLNIKLGDKKQSDIKR